MKTLIARLALASIAVASLGTSPAWSQDLVHKAAPQSHPIGIRGATLHTVSRGTLEDASLVFANGVITLVAGAEVATPVAADTEWIDGTGLHVYPGYVAFNSTMGLTEIGSVPMTSDVNAAGSVTPEVRAGVAVNADSWHIPVTRRNGVLTCGVMPTGGRVPGRATIVRMDGWTWEDMALVPDAGLVVNWPYAGPFGDDDDDGQENYDDALRDLDELFDTAAAYLAARAADPTMATDLRLEAMAGALTAKTPVFLAASSLLQIESAVAWAIGRSLRVVLVGGRDAGLCLDLLKRHDVPVAITSTHRLPRRRDISFASTYELPVLLERTGPVPPCRRAACGSATADRVQLFGVAWACCSFAQAQGVSEAISVAGVVETRRRTSSKYASGSTSACLHDRTRE